MRNLLDTASIAQSLDGERLTGSLPFPKQRIFLDRAGDKDVQTSAQESRGRNSGGSARPLRRASHARNCFQERYFERPSDPKVPMSIKVTMPGDEEATAKIDIDLLKAA